jgi:hypothetical protein
MSRIEISLRNIRPSDLPRENSWWRMRDWVDAPRLKAPMIDLSLLGVVLSETKDGIVFSKGGDHRLGSVAEAFGLDVKVWAELEPRSKTESVWDEKLREMAKRKVFNFEDWLDQVGWDVEDK